MAKIWNPAKLIVLLTIMALTLILITLSFLTEEKIHPPLQHEHTGTPGVDAKKARNTSFAHPPLQTSSQTVSNEARTHQTAIRNDFYHSKDYLEFLNKITAEKESAQGYFEYYSSGALLTCKSLELYHLPKDPMGKTIFDRGAVEKYFREQELKFNKQAAITYASRLYDKCESLYRDGRYDATRIEDLIKTMEISGHPDTIASKARQLLSENKNSDTGIRLLTQALFSEEGSAILIAGTTLISEFPVQEVSDDLLTNAWFLASCDFGNNCSDDSDITYSFCTQKNCPLHADLRSAIESSMSPEDFAHALSISVQISQEIRNRNFQGLQRGGYVRNL